MRIDGAAACPGAARKHRPKWREHDGAACLDQQRARNGSSQVAGIKLARQPQMKAIATFVTLMLFSVPCALVNLAVLGWLEQLSRGGQRPDPSFFQAVVPQLDVKFWFLGLLYVLFAQAIWLFRRGLLTAGASVSRSSGGGYDANLSVPVTPLQAYALSLIWSVVVVAVFMAVRSRLIG